MDEGNRLSRPIDGIGPGTEQAKIGNYAKRLAGVLQGDIDYFHHRVPIDQKTFADRDFAWKIKFPQDGPFHDTAVKVRDIFLVGSNVYPKVPHEKHKVHIKSIFGGNEFTHQPVRRFLRRLSCGIYANGLNDNPDIDWTNPVTDENKLYRIAYKIKNSLPTERFNHHSASSRNKFKKNVTLEEICELIIKGEIPLDPNNY